MSNKALSTTDSHLPVTEPGSCAGCVVSKETEDLVRELMVRFGDKWSLRVMDELYERGAMRFSRLRERLEGVSQKMLTQTLRQLERDGVVVRQVYAEVPPRVDYALTKSGVELSEALCGVWEWAIRYGEAVAASRAVFDGHTAGPAPKPGRDIERARTDFHSQDKPAAKLG